MEYGSQKYLVKKYVIVISGDQWRHQAWARPQNVPQSPQQ